MIDPLWFKDWIHVWNGFAEDLH